MARIAAMRSASRPRPRANRAFRSFLHDEQVFPCALAEVNSWSHSAQFVNQMWHRG